MPSRRLAQGRWSFDEYVTGPFPVLAKAARTPALFGGPGRNIAIIGLDTASSGSLTGPSYRDRGKLLI